MTNFRSVILTHLQERDQQCDKFARVFRAHEDLLESFNHILSTKTTDTLPKDSCDENEREVLQKELTAINDELSNVYKNKALNDQRLIDTNEKIIQLEQNVSECTKERDELIKRSEASLSELRSIEREIKKLQQDNETLNDECIASELLLNSTKGKLQAATDEQKELRIRLEQIKLKNEMMRG